MKTGTGGGSGDEDETDDSSDLQRVMRGDPPPALYYQERRFFERFLCERHRELSSLTWRPMSPAVRDAVTTVCGAPPRCDVCAPEQRGGR